MCVSELRLMSENSLLSISYDGSARVTDLRTGLKRLLIKNPHRKRYVSSGVFTEAQELYLVDETGRLEVWGLMMEQLVSVHTVSCGAMAGVGRAGSP